MSVIVSLLQAPATHRDPSLGFADPATFLGPVSILQIKDGVGVVSSSNFVCYLNPNNLRQVPHVVHPLCPEPLPDLHQQCSLFTDVEATLSPTVARNVELRLASTHQPETLPELPIVEDDIEIKDDWLFDETNFELPIGSSASEFGSFDESGSFIDELLSEFSESPPPTPVLQELAAPPPAITEPDVSTSRVFSSGFCSEEMLYGGFVDVNVGVVETLPFASDESLTSSDSSFDSGGDSPGNYRGKERARGRQRQYRGGDDEDDLEAADLPPYLRNVRNPSRKKCQNRDAALRYREKKRGEQKSLHGAVAELERLRDQVAGRVDAKRRELILLEELVAKIHPRSTPKVYTPY